jgi:hypothetical protein
MGDEASPIAVAHRLVGNGCGSSRKQGHKDKRQIEGHASSCDPFASLVNCAETRIFKGQSPAGLEAVSRFLSLRAV